MNSIYYVKFITLLAVDHFTCNQNSKNKFPTGEKFCVFIIIYFKRLYVIKALNYKRSSGLCALKKVSSTERAAAVLIIFVPASVCFGFACRIKQRQGYSDYWELYTKALLKGTLGHSCILPLTRSRSPCKMCFLFPDFQLFKCR